MIYFLLAILLVVVYDRIRYKNSVFRKIPGPPSFPIIGNTWNFISTPDDLFTYLRLFYRKYGNFSQVHAFNYQAVNLYDPEDIEKILSSTTYNDKRRPYTFLMSWLGEGLLTSNGDKWHQRRKLLTSAFHFNILKKYAMTFTEQTEEFLVKIEGETGRDKSDIVPLIINSTLRIMCETAMGTSITSDIKTVVDKYFQGMYNFIYCVVQRICRTWLYFDYVYIFTRMFWAQRTAVADLHKFTLKIIEERKALKQEDNIFTDIDDDVGMSKRGKLPMLDLLLEKEKKGEIDLRGIREEVDTFMFEGHDTTAMALIFIIMSIANENEVQEKIYEEMENIFGNSDRTPSIEDLNSMKYLECCIKESLRLYPSVPFIARNTPKDTVLSDYTIPANTICHIFVFDLHRRADIYPEPEKFIPERFLPENAHKRHPFSYLPFSAGPRNCIGQRFAMLEMKTMISGLVRKYRLEAVTTPEDLVFTTDLVLRPTHPVYVKFHKRT